MAVNTGTNAGNVGTGVNVAGDTYQFTVPGTSTATSPAGVEIDWKSPWVIIVLGALAIAAAVFYWRK